MGAGGGTNKTRMEVTKEALHAVLDEHKDKFNWGLQALVNTENDPNNADPKKRTKKNYTNGDETFNTKQILYFLKCVRACQARRCEDIVGIFKEINIRRSNP